MPDPDCVTASRKKRIYDALQFKYGKELAVLNPEHVKPLCALWNCEPILFALIFILRCKDQHLPVTRDRFLRFAQSLAPRIRIKHDRTHEHSKVVDILGDEFIDTLGRDKTTFNEIMDWKQKDADDLKREEDEREALLDKIFDEEIDVDTKGHLFKKRAVSMRVSATGEQIGQSLAMMAMQSKAMGGFRRSESDRPSNIAENTSVAEGKRKSRSPQQQTLSLANPETNRDDDWDYNEVALHRKRFYFHLSNFLIGPECIKAWVLAFCCYAVVPSYLDLGYNDIQDRGARHLARLLSSQNGANRLVCLDIRSNNITKYGAVALFRALRKNQTLVHLNLSSGESTSQEGKGVATTCVMSGRVEARTKTSKNVAAKNYIAGSLSTLGRYLASPDCILASLFLSDSGLVDKKTVTQKDFDRILILMRGDEIQVIGKEVAPKVQQKSPYGVGLQKSSYSVRNSDSSTKPDVEATPDEGVSNFGTAGDEEVSMAMGDGRKSIAEGRKSMSLGEGRKSMSLGEGRKSMSLGEGRKSLSLAQLQNPVDGEPTALAKKLHKVQSKHELDSEALPDDVLEGNKDRDVLVRALNITSCNQRVSTRFKDTAERKSFAKPIRSMSDGDFLLPTLASSRKSLKLGGELFPSPGSTRGSVTRRGPSMRGSLASSINGVASPSGGAFPNQVPTRASNVSFPDHDINDSKEGQPQGDHDLRDAPAVRMSRLEDSMPLGNLEVALPLSRGPSRPDTNSGPLLLGLSSKEKTKATIEGIETKASVIFNLEGVCLDSPKSRTSAIPSARISTAPPQIVGPEQGIDTQKKPSALIIPNAGPSLRSSVRPSARTSTVASVVGSHRGSLDNFVDPLLKTTDLGASMELYQMRGLEVRKGGREKKQIGRDHLFLNGDETTRNLMNRHEGSDNDGYVARLMADIDPEIRNDPKQLEAALLEKQKVLHDNVLKMRSRDPSQSEVVKLFKGLALNVSLRQLDLSNNGFGDSFFIHFCKAFSESRKCMNPQVLADRQTKKMSTMRATGAYADGMQSRGGTSGGLGDMLAKLLAEKEAARKDDQSIIVDENKDPQQISIGVLGVADKRASNQTMSGTIAAEVQKKGDSHKSLHEFLAMRNQGKQEESDTEDIAGQKAIQALQDSVEAKKAAIRTIENEIERFCALFDGGHELANNLNASSGKRGSANSINIDSVIRSRSSYSVSGSTQISFSQLEELNVSGNNISDEGLQAGFVMFEKEEFEIHPRFRDGVTVEFYNHWEEYKDKESDKYDEVTNMNIKHDPLTAKWMGPGSLDVDDVLAQYDTVEAMNDAHVKGIAFQHARYFSEKMVMTPETKKDTKKMKQINREYDKKQKWTPDKILDDAEARSRFKPGVGGIGTLSDGDVNVFGPTISHPTVSEASKVTLANVVEHPMGRPMPIYDEDMTERHEQVMQRIVSQKSFEKSENVFARQCTELLAQQNQEMQESMNVGIYRGNKTAVRAITASLLRMDLQETEMRPEHLNLFTIIPTRAKFREEEAIMLSELALQKELEGAVLATGQQMSTQSAGKQMSIQTDSRGFRTGSGGQSMSIRGQNGSGSFGMGKQLSFQNTSVGKQESYFSESFTRQMSYVNKTLVHKDDRFAHGLEKITLTDKDQPALSTLKAVTSQPSVQNKSLAGSIDHSGKRRMQQMSSTPVDRQFSKGSDDSVEYNKMGKEKRYLDNFLATLQHRQPNVKKASYLKELREAPDPSYYPIENESEEEHEVVGGVRLAKLPPGVVMVVPTREISNKDRESRGRRESNGLVFERYGGPIIPEYQRKLDMLASTARRLGGQNFTPVPTMVDYTFRLARLAFYQPDPYLKLRGAKHLRRHMQYVTESRSWNEELASAPKAKAKLKPKKKASAMARAMHSIMGKTLEVERAIERAKTREGLFDLVESQPDAAEVQRKNLLRLKSAMLEGMKTGTQTGGALWGKIKGGVMPKSNRFQIQKSMIVPADPSEDKSRKAMRLKRVMSRAVEEHEPFHQPEYEEEAGASPLGGSAKSVEKSLGKSSEKSSNKSSAVSIAAPTSPKGVRKGLLMLDTNDDTDEISDSATTPRSRATKTRTQKTRKKKMTLLPGHDATQKKASLIPGSPRPTTPMPKKPPPAPSFKTLGGDQDDILSHQGQAVTRIPSQRQQSVAYVLSSEQSVAHDPPSRNKSNYHKSLAKKRKSHRVDDPLDSRYDDLLDDLGGPDDIYGALLKQDTRLTLSDDDDYRKIQKKKNKRQHLITSIVTDTSQLAPGQAPHLPVGPKASKLKKARVALEDSAIVILSNAPGIQSRRDVGKMTPIQRVEPEDYDDTTGSGMYHSGRKQSGMQHSMTHSSATRATPLANLPSLGREDEERLGHVSSSVSNANSKGSSTIPELQKSTPSAPSSVSNSVRSLSPSQQCGVVKKISSNRKKKPKEDPKAKGVSIADVVIDAMKSSIRSPKESSVKSLQKTGSEASVDKESVRSVSHPASEKTPIQKSGASINARSPAESLATKVLQGSDPGSAKGTGSEGRKSGEEKSEKSEKSNSSENKSETDEEDLAFWDDEENEMVEGNPTIFTKYAGQHSSFARNGSRLSTIQAQIAELKPGELQSEGSMKVGGSLPGYHPGLQVLGAFSGKALPLSLPSSVAGAVKGGFGTLLTKAEKTRYRKQKLRLEWEKEEKERKEKAQQREKMRLEREELLQSQSKRHVDHHYLCTSLRRLDLSNNRISRFPHRFCGSLESLSLRNNPDMIISRVQRFKYLHKLDLSQCAVDVDLLLQITRHLGSITDLSVRGMSFVGAEEILGRLLRSRTLEKLNTHSCSLEDSLFIFEHLRRTRIKHLNLRDNCFTKNILPYIYMNKRILSLNLDLNQLDKFTLDKINQHVNENRKSYDEMTLEFAEKLRNLREKERRGSEAVKHALEYEKDIALLEGETEALHDEYAKLNEGAEETRLKKMQSFYRELCGRSIARQDDINGEKHEVERAFDRESGELRQKTNTLEVTMDREEARFLSEVREMKREMFALEYELEELIDKELRRRAKARALLEEMEAAKRSRRGGKRKEEAVNPMASAGLSQDFGQGALKAALEAVKAANKEEKDQAAKKDERHKAKTREELLKDSMLNQLILKSVALQEERDAEVERSKRWADSVYGVPEGDGEDDEDDDFRPEVSRVASLQGEKGTRKTAGKDSKLGKLFDAVLKKSPSLFTAKASNPTSPKKSPSMQNQNFTGGIKNKWTAAKSKIGTMVTLGMGLKITDADGMEAVEGGEGKEEEKTEEEKVEVQAKKKSRKRKDDELDYLVEAQRVLTRGTNLFSPMQQSNFAENLASRLNAYRASGKGEVFNEELPASVRVAASPTYASARTQARGERIIFDQDESATSGPKSGDLTNQTYAPVTGSSPGSRPSASVGFSIGSGTFSRTAKAVGGIFQAEIYSPTTEAKAVSNTRMESYLRNLTHFGEDVPKDPRIVKELTSPTIQRRQSLKGFDTFTAAAGLADFATSGSPKSLGIKRRPSDLSPAGAVAAASNTLNASEAISKSMQVSESASIRSKRAEAIENAKKKTAADLTASTENMVHKDKKKGLQFGGEQIREVDGLKGKSSSSSSSSDMDGALKASLKDLEDEKINGETKKQKKERPRTKLLFKRIASGRNVTKKTKSNGKGNGWKEGDSESEKGSYGSEEGHTKELETKPGRTSTENEQLAMGKMRTSDIGVKSGEIKRLDGDLSRHIFGSRFHKTHSKRKKKHLHGTKSKGLGSQSLNFLDQTFESVATPKQLPPAGLVEMVDGKQVIAKTHASSSSNGSDSSDEGKSTQKKPDGANKIGSDQAEAETALFKSAEGGEDYMYLYEGENGLLYDADGNTVQNADGTTIEQPAAGIVDQGAAGQQPQPAGSVCQEGMASNVNAEAGRRILVHRGGAPVGKRESAAKPTGAPLAHLARRASGSKTRARKNSKEGAHSHDDHSDGEFGSQASKKRRSIHKKKNHKKKRDSKDRTIDDTTSHGRADAIGVEQPLPQSVSQAATTSVFSNLSDVLDIADHAKAGLVDDFGPAKDGIYASSCSSEEQPVGGGQKDFDENLLPQIISRRSVGSPSHSTGRTSQQMKHGFKKTKIRHKHDEHGHEQYESPSYHNGHREMKPEEPKGKPKSHHGPRASRLLGQTDGSKKSH